MNQPDADELRPHPSVPAGADRWGCRIMLGLLLLALLGLLVFAARACQLSLDAARQDQREIEAALGRNEFAREEK